MKIPVVKSQDFTIYLEPYQGHTFIHCDVYHWTKTVKKALKAAFQSVLKIAPDPFAIVTPGDPKHQKFLNMFGFSPFSKLNGYTVWRHYGHS